jgi:hypothetical protein
MAENPVVGIRFAPEEVALIEAMAELEERSKADVVRRAVRAYAVQLGVEKPKRARSRKK